MKHNNARAFILGIFLATASSMAQASDAPELATVYNFRDVGGKPTQAGQCVRRGMVFRTATFVSTTEVDGAALQQRFHLNRYYDLRSTGEIQYFGSPKALTDAGVQWHQLNINNANDTIFSNKRPDAAAWSSFYERIIDVNGAAFVRLLEGLAYEEVPATYGCTFGKDRTGIATALFLGVLGVDTNTILDDYVVTTVELAAHAQAFSEVQKFVGVSYDDYVTYHLTANRETLGMFLRGLEQRYGDLTHAALSLGLRADTRDALRARYLVAPDHGGC